MNRLEKKCCIAAGGFHLLLIIILIVGPAFLSSDTKVDDSQAITMIDLGKLTDGPTMTGGNPQSAPPATQPPTPTPPAPQPPQPEPPAPEPPKQTLIEKLFTPQPPKVEEKTDDTPDEPEPKKVIIKAQDTDPKIKTSNKPKIEIAKKTVVRNTKTTKKVATATTSDTSDEEAEAKAAAAAAAKAKRDRAAQVSRILGGLSGSLSSGTEVSIPGPGAGTFVNYAEAVRRVYTEAWIAPTDVTDDEATAKVSITISRDGNVVSARIKTPSGSSAVDRSVQETLRRVKYVAPFPDGAKDSERTFIINFNLKAKRSLG